MSARTNALIYGVVRSTASGSYAYDCTPFLRSVYRVNGPITGFFCLALISVVYVSAATGIERLRLVVSGRQVSTMLGVFTFAGVVMLPSRYLLTLVAVIYSAAWPTFKRAGLGPVKHVYSTATVAVGCMAASGTVTHLRGPVALVSAVLVFAAVNACLLAVGMVAAREWQALPYLRKWRVWAMVVGTQWLGAALGLAMHWHPAGSAAVLPVVGLVHREALQSTLRMTRAYVDNVWNRDGWLTLAEEAQRRREWFSIVIVDTSHPRQAAAVVLSCIEGTDSVGAYSDTQLAVLLRDTPAAAAWAVARDIELALARAGIPAAAGSADSKAGDVSAMLALACGDAVLWQVRLSDLESDLR